MTALLCHGHWLLQGWQAVLLSVSQTLFCQALHPLRQGMAAAVGLIASETAWPRWALQSIHTGSAAQPGPPKL